MRNAHGPTHGRGLGLVLALQYADTSTQGHTPAQRHARRPAEPLPVACETLCSKQCSGTTTPKKMLCSTETGPQGESAQNEGARHVRRGLGGSTSGADLAGQEPQARSTTDIHHIAPPPPAPRPTHTRDTRVRTHRASRDHASTQRPRQTHALGHRTLQRPRTAHRRRHANTLIFRYLTAPRGALRGSGERRRTYNSGGHRTKSASSLPPCGRHKVFAAARRKGCTGGGRSFP